VKVLHRFVDTVERPDVAGPAQALCRPRPLHARPDLQDAPVHLGGLAPVLPPQSARWTLGSCW
jgi:hypothetical protein